MITYRVKSGDMDATVKTPYPAQAPQIAAMAFDRLIQKNKAPKNIGLLVEVSGGQYSGDEVMYYSSEVLLASMGRMSK